MEKNRVQLFRIYAILDTADHKILRMEKGAKTMRKLDLNAIYISERVQETLRLFQSVH